MRPVETGAQDERRLRREVALACRVLGAHGLGDALYGHVSGRLPGWDRFWMKPAGLGLEEVGEDDLVLVDQAGGLLAGGRPVHREWPIHAEAMRARPDVTCVIHTHPRHGIALPASGRRLLPVCQDSQLFVEAGVPVFDAFAHLVTTREDGAAVAAVLGPSRAAFLLNHGVVVAGADVAEATCAALMLERACEVQLLAQPAAGQPVAHASRADALAVAAIRGADMRRVFEYHVRRLDRSTRG
jgi:L-fuculose-phosphate aldolase